MAAAASPPRREAEPLPLDLQLEIVAHSDDAATILRCAAASRALWLAVRGPGFRPRRRAALRAAARAGLDPADLLGVSHACGDHGAAGDGDAVDQPSPRRFRVDPGLLRSFEPVSWRERDGLLVLWRLGAAAEPEPELLVCDTSTGRVTPFPCMDVEGKWGNGGIYCPAFLSVAGARRSFEILVMDVCLRARTFSSKRGRWGQIRAAKPPPEHGSWCVISEATRTSPAVVGRTAHWVCSSTRTGGVFILALHADAAQAAAIEPPPCCIGSEASCWALAAEADGKLSVVVPEAEAISMWTLSAAAGWSRQAVISKPGISAQVAPGVDASRMVCWCVWAGHPSAAVVLWVEGIGLVQIDMGTMKAVALRRGGERGMSAAAAAARVCLHEIDLVALL